MAAAEARAVWQRTANRCFVQEDAKRAPKLACCQSSSSSSNLVEGVPTGVGDVLDNPSSGFMPLNRSPSYSNLSPDTRWWLQLQPCYGYRKGLTYEQLNSLEAEMENLRAGIVKSPSRVSEVCSQDTGDSKCIDCPKYSEPAYFKIYADYTGKDLEAKQQAEEASYDQDAQHFVDLKDTRKNSKVIEMDNECPKSQKSDDYCLDPESPWITGEKNVPWWRATDKDDLPTLVAQKSLDYIENCDLPPPQKTNMKRYRCACPGSSDRHELLTPSLDWKAHGRCTPSSVIHVKGCPNSEGISGRHRTSAENSLSDSDRSSSYTSRQKDTTGTGQASESDSCKAQLLEALCHSQTRAREAEKAAKQLCAEKEHLINLFFKQASQLFAYKQWFQLLQLERLYHSSKDNTDRPTSTLFPLALPWIPPKGRKIQKNWQKSARGKRSKQNRGKHVSKYIVAFALGLGLVGAGLLLGWTVGWMLPF
ncbi:hypothetical protein K2173_003451 [Erythroxylum novogranatense]|uniref:Uncharacterized protein n=1 Tax=Erythroxylum novogranatense TaxID=1862640 RepID=A0AAV8S931_9ROSI|nr:hypothetical protein K2173_003451 [Erythroxylum novogranatense]